MVMAKVCKSNNDRSLLVDDEWWVMMATAGIAYLLKPSDGVVISGGLFAVRGIYQRK